MPASLKLQAEYGEDLQVVFVESQGATQEKSVGFAMARKWMGTRAMWTKERPFDTGATGLPNFALVSADGKVLMKGNPLAMKSAIEDAIAKEVAKGKQAPEGTPKSLAKAWKSFGKGDYGKAVAEARKVADKGGDDAEDAAVTASTFERRIGAKLDQVAWLIDNGHYGEAADRIKELKKATKGLDESQDRLSLLDERLDSPELEDEIDAHKAFAKLEEELNENGPEDKTLQKIEKFTSKHAGTKAAARARMMLDYLAAA